MNQGIQADYILADSWYARPNFIKEVSALDMPVITRIANNERIWNFKGKHKTLNSMYSALSKARHSAHGRNGKIRYTYFATVAEHKKLGRVKLVFLHTGKDMIVFISIDFSLSAEDIITTYRKLWNIEQGLKDLRIHFGFGMENKNLLHIITVLRAYTQ